MPVYKLTEYIDFYEAIIVRNDINGSSTEQHRQYRRCKANLVNLNFFADKEVQVVNNLIQQNRIKIVVRNSKSKPILNNMVVKYNGDFYEIISKSYADMNKWCIATIQKVNTDSINPI